MTKKKEKPNSQKFLNTLRKNLGYSSYEHAKLVNRSWVDTFVECVQIDPKNGITESLLNIPHLGNIHVSYTKYEKPRMKSTKNGAEVKCRTSIHIALSKNIKNKIKGEGKENV